MWLWQQATKDSFTTYTENVSLPSREKRRWRLYRQQDTNTSDVR
jgi:hypothetical protein